MGEFPDRGAKLFREDFGKRAKTMADNIHALKGVLYKKPGLFLEAPTRKGDFLQIGPRVASRTGTPNQQRGDQCFKD